MLCFNGSVLRLGQLWRNNGPRNRHWEGNFRFGIKMMASGKCAVASLPRRLPKSGFLTLVEADACVAHIGFESADQRDSLGLQQTLHLPELVKSAEKSGCMKNSLSSIPTQRIARSLLLILAATAACTFFSACAGHETRVERRQDRRENRQERRADRQERRQDFEEQILQATEARDPRPQKTSFSLKAVST